MRQWTSALFPWMLLSCWLSAGVEITEEKLFPADNGDVLQIQNDYGKIRLSASTSNQVRVRIRRTAQSHGNLDNITIIAQKAGNRIFVHSHYYDYQGESVDLEIQAPGWINLALWGANPWVEVNGFSGFTRIHSQTGDIRASQLSGSASLISDRGDILLQLSREPAADIRAESTTGTVHCQMDPQLNVRGWLRAGGRLSWNREFEMEGGQLERQLGVGGPLVLLTSLQGDVQVDLRIDPWLMADNRPAAIEVSEERHERNAPPPVLSEPRAPVGSGDEDEWEPVEERPAGDSNSGSAAPANPDEPFSLKVDVNWTRLNVSVRDRYTNRSVPHLQAADFEITEDGVLQSIERFESVEAPFDLLLLLDVSGSTKEHLGLIKEASIEFTREIRREDRIAVATFNSNTRLVQPFTNDRRAVERSINRIRSGGGTAFYDALETSLQQYMAGREGRKAIVVFSDGEDNQLTGDWSAGSQTTFPQLYRLIEESDSIIYTIFLENDGNSRVQRRGPGRRNPRGGGGVIDILGEILKPGGGAGVPPISGGDAREEARRQMLQIADQTGGRMYSPTSIFDLGHAYGEIADDLRIQYSLVYSSTNQARDGKWRRIRVDIRGRNDLAARTRKGYYAPQPSGGVGRTPFIN